MPASSPEPCMLSAWRAQTIGFLNEWWVEKHKLGSEKKMPDPSCKVKCWFANTYFYDKLTVLSDKYDYDAVKRWTRRIQIFELDKVLGAPKP